jgi:DNA binding domain, excisionase family
MRSSLTAVPAGRTDRLLTLLEQVEAVAGDLSADVLLDVIGRTARLETVLRSRYAVLMGPAHETPMPSSGPRYLDVAAAADYLSVSKSTVLRLAKTGTLHSCRPKGTVREGVRLLRFDRQDLDDYMKERRP